MSKKSKGNSEVGNDNPAKLTQFKKGQSGSKSRGRISRKPVEIDVAATLNEPVTIKTKEGEQKMIPFEIGVRQLAKRAIERGKLEDITAFLSLCEAHGVIAQKPAKREGGVVVAPEGVDFHEWAAEFPKMLVDDDDESR